MFEFLFISVPIALVGYVIVVVVLSQFTLPETVSPSASEAHPTHVSAADEALIEAEESNTETWQVDHEPEGLTELNEEAVALFDPMSLIEIDESEAVFEDDPLPSDVVLRRHYLTHLRMMLDTLHRVPEDAVLRRHHLQQMDVLFEDLVTDIEAVEALVAAYEARGIRVTPA